MQICKLGFMCLLIVFNYYGKLATNNMRIVCGKKDSGFSIFCMSGEKGGKLSLTAERQILLACSCSRIQYLQYQVVETVPISLIPAVTALPPRATWCPIETNVMAGKSRRRLNRLLNLFSIIIFYFNCSVDWKHCCGAAPIWSALALGKTYFFIINTGTGTLLNLPTVKYKTR